MTSILSPCSHLNKEDNYIKKGMMDGDAVCMTVQHMDEKLRSEVSRDRGEQNHSALETVY